MTIPLPPPDSRSFADLVRELMSRVPAHTPDWGTPREGDPGRVLLEMYAWLTADLIQRAAQVPELQRRAFLRLLGEPLRPAQHARGLVGLTLAEGLRPVTLRAGARLEGPVPFEAQESVVVLPGQAELWWRRPLDPDASSTHDARARLAGVLGLDPASILLYESARLPQDRAFALDLREEPADASIWIALLAPPGVAPEAVRAALVGVDGTALVVNLGVTPDQGSTAAWDLQATSPPRRFVLETVVAGAGAGSAPRLTPLEVLSDGTMGLIRAGVVRAVLPPGPLLAAPLDDAGLNLEAGVGADAPPRLDDPGRAARLVGWLRLRLVDDLGPLPLSWVGLNAVSVVQQERVQRVTLGVSDGAPGQRMPLPLAQIAPDLELEVDEVGQGYVPWRRVETLFAHDRDARVFVLDSEANVVQFGDGVCGRVPPQGRRVRLGQGRAGGGARGNLSPGSLRAVSGVDLDGAPVVAPLRVVQTLPTTGGADAEGLDEAERRLPARLRHQDRAVSAQDFLELTRETPGVRLGRVEVLEGFKPHQRAFEVPGVVSVMVLPGRSLGPAPYPRPDALTLQAVQAWLDPRRLVGTELYVIGCDYVPLGVSVAVRLHPAADRALANREVRQALLAALWPLPLPGAGAGWPLGRAVRDRELTVAVARVPAVSEVLGLHLYSASATGWALRPPEPDGARVLTLRPWQLPELLALQIGDAHDTPPPLVAERAQRGGLGAATLLPVPVAPGRCE